VSLCTYARTPDGDHRVRVEGNLTTLLHGDGSAALSLHPDELPAAVSGFLEAAAGLLPSAGLPAPAGWDVHRMDPSATYLLPEDLPVALVVDAAFRAFMVAASPRQVVTRHNSQTVTYRMSKWRSWTVYDKGAEIAHKTPGATAPDNLIRMEARVRPRNATGEWKESAPTLAAMDTLLSRSVAESAAMMGNVAQYVGATGTLAVVRLLIRGGCTLNTALRLASVMDLSEAFGDQVLNDLGGSERSVARWRAEVKRYIEAAGGEDALQAELPGLIATAMPAFARDFTVTRNQPATEDE
jgi:hypothetical protein